MFSSNNTHLTIDIAGGEFSFEKKYIVFSKNKFESDLKRLDKSYFFKNFVEYYSYIINNFSVFLVKESVDVFLLKKFVEQAPNIDPVTKKFKQFNKEFFKTHLNNLLVLKDIHFLNAFCFGGIAMATKAQALKSFEKSHNRKFSFETMEDLISTVHNYFNFLLNAEIEEFFSFDHLFLEKMLPDEIINFCLKNKIFSKQPAFSFLNESFGKNKNYNIICHLLSKDKFLIKDEEIVEKLQFKGFQENKCLKPPFETKEFLDNYIKTKAMESNSKKFIDYFKDEAGKYQEGYKLLTLYQTLNNNVEKNETTNQNNVSCFTTFQEEKKNSNLTILETLTHSTLEKHTKEANENFDMNDDCDRETEEDWKTIGFQFEKDFNFLLNNPISLLGEEGKKSLVRVLNKSTKSVKDTPCIVLEPNQDIYKTDLIYKNKNKSFTRFSLKTVKDKSHLKKLRVLSGGSTVFIDFLLSLIEKKNPLMDVGFNNKEKMILKNIIPLLLDKRYFEKNELCNNLFNKKENKDKYVVLLKESQKLDTINLISLKREFPEYFDLVDYFFRMNSKFIFEYVLLGKNLEKIKFFVVQNRKDNQIYIYDMVKLLSYCHNLPILKEKEKLSFKFLEMVFYSNKTCNVVICFLKNIVKLIEPSLVLNIDLHNAILDHIYTLSEEKP